MSNRTNARIASEVQLELFAAPQQLACGRFIDDETYAAILYLRRSGHSVRRCGLSHVLDGTIVSSSQLRFIARRRGFAA